MPSGFRIFEEAKVIMATSLVPVLLQPEDPELNKQMEINKIVVEDDLLGNIEEKYSCWLKIKRIIALVLKQYKIEKEDDANKIKKGIRFFH